MVATPPRRLALEIKMNTRLLLLAVSILVFALPVTGSADQVRANDLVNEAEKEPAAEPMHVFQGPDELIQAARRGDAAAQLEVAILYEYGFNMPDNQVYALAWYLLAAEGGSAKAASHRDELIGKLSAGDVDRARGMSKTLATAARPAAPAQQTAPADETPSEEIAPIPEKQ